MKKAIIIFTRNPELGKCKTRLAKSIGNEEALKVYKHLLTHTATVTKNVNADKYVFYSEQIHEDDLWSNKIFQKELQQGSDLGERMKNAFKLLFHKNYEDIIIVGSDLLDLNAEIINEAFTKLKQNDVVIGPAEDGGYYLLGMSTLDQNIFNIENWGTETVYEQTVSKLNHKSVYVLKTLNDIDYVEDLKPYEVFKKYFIKNTTLIL